MVPRSSGSRLSNAISINQRYAGHARHVGHAGASVHTGAYLGRYVVVVDEDIDVMDMSSCSRLELAGDIDATRPWEWRPLPGVALTDARDEAQGGRTLGLARRQG